MKSPQEILKMMDDLEYEMDAFLLGHGWNSLDDNWGSWDHPVKCPRGTLNNLEAFLMECQDAGVEVE